MIGPGTLLDDEDQKHLEERSIQRIGELQAIVETKGMARAIAEASGDVLGAAHFLRLSGGRDIAKRMFRFARDQACLPVNRG